MAVGYTPPRRKHPADNFKLALGMGVNWVDLDKGYMYMIQEYKEALDNPEIPKDKKPTKIRVLKADGETEVGWVLPEVVEERMKDPEPDPRYEYDPPKKGKW
jgi:hypothetical protein